MPGIPSKDASFVRETPRNYALTIKELVNEGLLKKRSGGFNKPNHLFVILPGEQKGTTGETANGTTVGAKKAPLTVHKGPTNYYNKTLDETTYTYDEGESF